MIRRVGVVIEFDDGSRQFTELADPTVEQRLESGGVPRLIVDGWIAYGVAYNGDMPTRPSTGERPPVSGRKGLDP